MIPYAPSLLLSGGLCLAMLLCSELGYQVGLRLRKDLGAKEQLGVIEAAILGLLGLLLGFTLQSSMSRLDEKRHLVVEEANAIGTAYLRLDLLQPADQPQARNLFRSYLESRLRVYEIVESGGNADETVANTLELQHQIWNKVVDSSRKEPPGASVRLTISAMNEMIDVTTSRIFASRTTLPALILALLFAVAIVSAFLTGYALSAHKRRHVLYAVTFSLIISATIYTLLDLDNPRFGLIRINAAERNLREIHDSIP